MESLVTTIKINHNMEIGKASSDNQQPET